jgi:hypothetical protein
MTVQTFRIVTSRGHQYRQRVEHFWDPKTKRTRTRILQNFGPIHPVYPRLREPQILPLELPHFGLLATHIMMGSLTAAQVIDTVREMGQEIPPGDLTAVGIRYDLGEKKLELLLWLTPSLPPPRPAPSVKPPPSSSGPAPPTPSRSKAKRA